MKTQRQQKSLRNQPELYDQVKQPVSVGLTPAALAQLDSLAQRANLSRSELIERIARGLVEIHLNPAGFELLPPDRCRIEEGVITLYYPDLLHQDSSKLLKVLICRNSSVSEGHNNSS